MQQFSISNKENLEKIKAIFDSNSLDGIKLRPKEIIKFVVELGMNNDLFMRDLQYYFPQYEQGEGITYDEMVKFLDYILRIKKSENEKIEAFKCFDKYGVGQIHTADLLAILKKRLATRDYELYSQLISSSYGPLINYMDLFKKSKKYK